MKILQDIWGKCKGEWFTGTILVLVALAAFGLGRLSALQPVKTPVELVEVPKVEIPSIDNNKNVSSDEVVASKEGSKYHYPWCPGAKQIKEGNKISFASVAAARAAGYTPAGNCPNLN